MFWIFMGWYAISLAVWPILAKQGVHRTRAVLSARHHEQYVDSGTDMERPNFGMLL